MRFSSPRADTGQPVMSTASRVPRASRKALGARRRHALRIKRTAHPFTATLEYMGIDHRGADIFMPQQLLHSADIIAIFQQVGRK